MSPRKPGHDHPKPTEGLSFAFPMRLPENGTGAGGADRSRSSGPKADTKKTGTTPDQH